MLEDIKSAMQENDTAIEALTQLEYVLQNSAHIQGIVSAKEYNIRDGVMLDAFFKRLHFLRSNLLQKL